MIRTRKLFFLNVDDIWFEAGKFADSRSPIAILHTYKVISPESYSFKINEKTFFIDLGNSLEQIFGAFKKSAKYPIKKAARDGVKVYRSENDEDTNKFYEYYLQFARSRKMPPIKIEDLENYDIFLAEDPKKNLIGGGAFLKDEEKTIYRYKHGATSHDLNANDLILWEAMKFAKAQGYKFFDMGGIIKVDNKNNYYHSHYKFKEKFSGQESDFYSYYKARGILLPLLFRLSNITVGLIFNGNYNEFINKLAKFKIIRS